MMRNKIIFVIILSLTISTHLYSQDDEIIDLKYSMTSKFNNIELHTIVDLLYEYQNNEIELLTLEMKKIGNIKRKIKDGKIYFGSGNYFEDIINGVHPYQVGNLNFSRSTSPKIIDNLKYYTTLNIYLTKDNLYDIIINLSTSEYYKYISSKIINGGVVKKFEYISKNIKRNFIVQTFDGDNESKVTFYLSN